LKDKLEILENEQKSSGASQPSAQKSTRSASGKISTKAPRAGTQDKPDTDRDCQEETKEGPNPDALRLIAYTIQQEKSSFEADDEVQEVPSPNDLALATKAIALVDLNEEPSVDADPRLVNLINNWKVMGLQQDLAGSEANNMPLRGDAKDYWQQLMGSKVKEVTVQ
jgi:hypothetical protein